MIDEKIVCAFKDLVDITFNDMFMIVYDPDKEAIVINCAFLKEYRDIILPIVELELYKNSASGFINYLKEKITEGIK